MKAIKDLVWFEPIETEDVTAAGIILHQEKKVSKEGIVVAIGIKCDTDYLKGVEIGTKILFNPQDAKDVEVDGKKYKTIRDKQVMAILG